MNSLATLAARLDPHYALKVRHLEADIHARYAVAQLGATAAMEREQYKASHQQSLQHTKDDAALEREHVRGKYGLDKAKIAAESATERLNAEIAARADVEKMRAESAMSVAEQQANTQRGIAELQHASAVKIEADRATYDIQRLEADLAGKLALSAADSGVLATHKLIDEYAANRASAVRQFEERSRLRGDVFKMLAGAIIQEKLAQKQHARDIERIKVEGEQRRSASYLDSLSAYLSRLVDSGQEQRARQEIDRLSAEWSNEESLSKDIGHFKRENGL